MHPLLSQWSKTTLLLKNAARGAGKRNFIVILLKTVEYEHEQVAVQRVWQRGRG